MKSIEPVQSVNQGLIMSGTLNLRRYAVFIPKMAIIKICFSENGP